MQGSGSQPSPDGDSASLEGNSGIYILMPLMLTTFKETLSWGFKEDQLSRKGNTEIKFLKSFQRLSTVSEMRNLEEGSLKKEEKGSQGNLSPNNFPSDWHCVCGVGLEMGLWEAFFSPSCGTICFSTWSWSRGGGRKLQYSHEMVWVNLANMYKN